MATVTSVDEGDRIKLKDLADRRRKIVYTVSPTCPNKNWGRWLCITHGQGFSNQIEKDFHIEQGAHQLAWLCFEHGYEKP